MVFTQFSNYKIVFFVFLLTFFQVSCSFLPDRAQKELKNRPFPASKNSVSYQNLNKSYKGSRLHIPYHFNRRVGAWLDYYQGRGRKVMMKYLTRSSRYLPLIKRELRKANLPEDLSYIVFVESGFNPKAHSRANAVGYWQFIKTTGRNYGLKINGYIDERRDIILSTRAAIRYFEALYTLFDDWFLAMAAYNTGENRVKRLVMRYKTRNYWDLVYRRKLLRETRNYVPKFLAVRLIAKNPERFGFQNLDFEPELQYKTYIVQKPLSFKKLSHELGDFSYYKELRRLNPKFKTPYVLPYYRNKKTVLRLPVRAPYLTHDMIENSLAKGPFRPVSDYVYYRIRRGDSLSRIAERFRVSYRGLIKTNRIRRPSYIRVGQLIKIPKRYGKTKTKRVRRRRRLNLVGNFKNRSYKNKNMQIHTVKRGESLTLIAEKYRVSIKKLAQANSIRNLSSIYPGEKLVIPD